MWGRLFYGLIGVLLLPSVAGLGNAVFALLVNAQMDFSGASLLVRFLIGVFLWAFLFATLTKPMRSYVLAHEMSHVIAAWLSGKSAGQLKIGAESGSVRVSGSNVFIALAPYMLPFYSLLVLLAHVIASLWWDPALWVGILPVVLGFTWCYHITFTCMALSHSQSDLNPYGRLGALPIILFGNLLILTLSLTFLTPEPPARDAKTIWTLHLRAYQVTLRQLRQLIP